MGTLRLVQIVAAASTVAYHPREMIAASSGWVTAKLPAHDEEADIGAALERLRAVSSWIPENIPGAAG